VGELRHVEVLETAATMPGECRTVCDLCKGNLGSLKHVHIEGWLQDHKDRCEFLGRVGVDMSSICCICKALTTNIMRATKAYMEGPYQVITSHDGAMVGLRR